jgi:hypothetical protein
MTRHFRFVAAFAILSMACGSSSSGVPAGGSDATADGDHGSGDDAGDSGASDGATSLTDAEGTDGEAAAPPTDDASLDADATSDATLTDAMSDAAMGDGGTDAAGAMTGDAASDAMSNDAAGDAMSGDAASDAAPLDAGSDATADASSSLDLPLGSTCATGTDCASGFCIPVVPGASPVCVTSCTQQSDCAAATGYFCDPLIAGSAQGYCVAHSPEHCASCVHDADCGALSESCFLAPGDDALACHVDCSISGADACPPDYTCTSETVKGVARKLCRPTLVPDCADAQGGYCDVVTTPQACGRANASGVCTAQRACDLTQRFEACPAPAPQCKADCTVQDPAGCATVFCATATTTPTNCGTCGTVCPGYMQPKDNVTCQGGATCTFSCQGESYDVDNAAVNGCEVDDGPTGNHTSSAATNLGSQSCDNGFAITGATGTLPSDKRVHQSPAITGFDAASGSAPDWFKITGTGGLSCTNDIVATLTISGSAAPTCYKLTVITDKNTYSQQTDATGTAKISQGSGQYSDNSVITFEVQKTCGTSVIEDVSYAITGNL